MRLSIEKMDNRGQIVFVLQVDGQEVFKTVSQREAEDLARAFQKGFTVGWDSAINAARKSVVNLKDTAPYDVQAVLEVLAV